MKTDNSQTIWHSIDTAPRDGKPFLVYGKGLYAIYKFDPEFGYFEANDDPYFPWCKARGWTHLPEMPENDPE